MLLELNQLCFSEESNQWKSVPLLLQSKSIAGFYTHPDYNGPCVVLIAGTGPLIVEENYDVLYSLLDEKATSANANVMEWIPCTDRLPPVDGDYLVTTNRLSYSVDFETFKHGKWAANGSKILAWMPIPKPFWMASKK